MRQQYCTKCSSIMLCKDGTEIRRFKDENSYDYEIQLQRYYCPCCKERYIEWPDCFEKGKVYLKNIMDRVRDGDKELEMILQCNRTTIYRWKKRG